MSLKMHNLYIYSGEDIESLFKELKELRKEYLAWIRSYIQKEMGKLFIANRQGLYQFIERETVLGTRSPLNLDVSAVIYLHEGHLPLVQFFGVPESLLEGKQYLEDFSYDGRSDRPDEVSQEMWEYRKEVIDSLLEEDDRPSRAGLAFIFSNKDDIYRIVYG